MVRRVLILLAIAAAMALGSLIARGCYPKAPAAIPRTPATTVSGEETFPEPDLASVRSRASDLIDQIKGLRLRLNPGGESPAAVASAFRNVERLSGSLEQQAREIVSRLGTGGVVDPAEAEYVKKLAETLRTLNRGALAQARVAMDAGKASDVAGALDGAATALTTQVSVPRAAPDPDHAADLAARLEALEKSAGELARQTLEAARGTGDTSVLKPLVAEAGRRLEEFSDALRQAGDQTPGAAQAAALLAETTPVSARGTLARVARSVRGKKYQTARAAARRFTKAVAALGRALAGSAPATPIDPAATSSPNPAAAETAFDQKAPITRHSRGRRAAAARAAEAAEAEKATGPVRPKVVLHPELIPKNIRIVRIYYATMIAGPGDTIEFDINGSGFNEEFHKRLTVQSGMPQVDVKDFSLVTPNQIHGRLVIGASAATAFSFPTVSIGGKVVFQASSPFAVIRPGEVLNLVFTEMGESGRTGRFRVFTNLDEAALPNFRVEPSTSAIVLGGLTAHLPFVVDGTISVGPAVTGVYGVKVLLKDKVLWQRDGIIRIVSPNVGATGLVLRLQAEDGFHRPGDTARFLVQGSGFQGGDAEALTAEIPNLPGASGKFTFLAPGRMSLDVQIPARAPVGAYTVSIRNKDKVLLDTPSAFRVVPPNWLRSISTTPPLKPGGAGQIVLQGRSLQEKFVAGLRVRVDEPGLKIGAFHRVSAIQATADVTADRSVRPGDYQVRMHLLRRRIVPESGDIIRIVPAE